MYEPGDSASHGGCCIRVVAERDSTPNAAFEIRSLLNCLLGGPKRIEDIAGPSNGRGIARVENPLDLGIWE